MNSVDAQRGAASKQRKPKKCRRKHPPRFKLVFHNKTSAGFFFLICSIQLCLPPPPSPPQLQLSTFTWARWSHVFPLLLINLASWQIVHCDTSVGGKGNWYGYDLTCPAGGTGGRYHGDFSCRPTSV